MKKIILAISILELVVAGLLIGIIIKKLESKSRSEALGLIHESPIDKTKIKFENSNFQNYWEYNPAITVDDEGFWEGSRAHYTINNDRLNERFDYEVEKPKDTFRIITLGDSFTFGQYVDTSKNWTELLENNLTSKLTCGSIDKIEVINLGMPGFDIPYLVKRYEDRGIKYNADLIIYFESGSGYVRNNEYLKPLMEDCDSTAGKKRLEYHNCRRDAQIKMYSKYGGEIIRNDILSSVAQFLYARGETPIIFASYNSMEHEEFIKTANGQFDGLYFINVSNNKNIGLKFPDGHPNQKGHRDIASDIFNYLESNKKLFFYVTKANDT